MVSNLIINVSKGTSMRGLWQYVWMCGENLRFEGKFNELMNKASNE